MATKTIVELIDDLDGSHAVETVTFALDGETYEIDLNPDHAEALRENVGEFKACARAVRGGSPKRQAKQSVRADRREDLPAIREWARVNGWPDVANRGRVQVEIVAAYDAAH
jgi:hypothetical protein